MQNCIISDFQKKKMSYVTKDPVHFFKNTHRSTVSVTGFEHSKHSDIQKIMLLRLDRVQTTSSEQHIFLTTPLDTRAYMKRTKHIRNSERKDTRHVKGSVFLFFNNDVEDFLSQKFYVP